MLDLSMQAHVYGWLSLVESGWTYHPRNKSRPNPGSTRGIELDRENERLTPPQSWTSKSKWKLYSSSLNDGMLLAMCVVEISAAVRQTAVPVTSNLGHKNPRARPSKTRSDTGWRC